MFLLVSGTAFATNHPLGKESLPNSKIASLILSDYKDSVDYCSKGKIYLKSETIVSENDSLWIYNDHSALEIPYLHYDTSGYFIATGTNAFIPWYKCPRCKRVWDLISHPSNLCPICKIPGELQGT